MSESESAKQENVPVGIGGWLAFFILTMMVFSPFMDVSHIVEHPNEIHNPLVWLVIVAFDGLGFYAGILMLQGKSKGIQWAKIRLMVGLGIGALGIVGSIMGGLADPHATATASDFTSSIRTIIYSAIWLAYLGESKRVKNTYPSEPAKENQQVPMDTTTPAPTDQRVRFWPIIRDVLIVSLFTFMGGFVLGIVSGKAGPSVAALATSNLLLGTVAFTIAGCLTPLRRWRHLGFVAVGAWLVSLMNVAFFGVSIPEWIGGAIAMAIMMGLGGAISGILRKEIKPSVCECAAPLDSSPKS